MDSKSSWLVFMTVSGHAREGKIVMAPILLAGITTSDQSSCQFGCQFGNKKMIGKTLFYGTSAISPVHLVWDLESLPLIQSLYFFSKNVKKITSVG